MYDRLSVSTYKSMSENFEQQGEIELSERIKEMLPTAKEICSEYDAAIEPEQDRIIIHVEAIDPEQREKLKERLAGIVGMDYEVVSGVRATGEVTLPQRLLFITKATN